MKTSDMASMHFTILRLFTILLTILHPSSAVNKESSSSPSSIYDLLNSHGLPVGLVPKGISNFSMDAQSGRFEVHLPQSCAAQFETHVRYDSTVSGILSYGQISGLSGVAAQDLFLWFDVKEIRVDIPSSGLIYFDVGVVSKQFSLSFFETPRDCSVAHNSGRIVQNLSRKLIKEHSEKSEVIAVY